MKTVALGTTTVRRGALVTTERFRGRLRYPARGAVHLSGPGTVTSLPRVGRILSDGAVAAGVDDSPIGVLFGATPLYRTLATPSTTGARLALQSADADLLAAQAAVLTPGSPPIDTRTVADAGDGAGETRAAEAAHVAAVARAEVGVAEARERLLAARRNLTRLQTPQLGLDVALVADDMTALGYGRGFTDRWDPALVRAVRAWQRHIGAAPSGDIGPGDVIVVHGAVRVTGVQGQVGGPASAVTLTLSSPVRVATFSLPDGAPGAITPDRRVRLSAAGRTTIGRVAGLTSGRHSTIVQVSLPARSSVARAGGDRVTMSVTTTQTRDALLVPTQALVALASGGYALQLPDGRLLAVHTGPVQNGDIEVSGAGVRVGLRVVSVA